MAVLKCYMECTSPAYACDLAMLLAEAWLLARLIFHFFNCLHG